MPLKETNWDNELFGPYIDTIYKKMEIPFKPKMNVTVLTKGYHLRMKTYINHISSYAPYIPELKEYLFKFKHPTMAAAKEKLRRDMEQRKGGWSSQRQGKGQSWQGSCTESKQTLAATATAPAAGGSGANVPARRLPPSTSSITPVLGHLATKPFLPSSDSSFPATSISSPAAADAAAGTTLPHTNNPLLHPLSGSLLQHLQF